MEGVLAILLIFGGPVAVLISRRYFAYREKLLELEKLRIEKGLLPESAEKRQIEARLENLEGIVTSVDFELNQRLNRLAMETSRLLPAAAGMTDAANAGASRPSLGPVIAPFRVGQTIAERYEVLRELGRGGMGAVYLAKDAVLAEEVALKTILISMADNHVAMGERFRREVAAARRVTHENVVRIHDLGEEGPVVFLSMEYVSGTTLHDYVSVNHPLPIDEVLRILRGIANGVAAAHSAGVVHRDLKPRNVLLSDDGSVVKVIDFGLASASFGNDLTATGMIMGTPEYMPPEQIRGKSCDQRTDVYALGAMAFFVLCGRPPFAAATPIAVGFSQVHEEPPKPTDQREDVPIELERAILRALAKEQAERYQDAGQWRAAIDGVVPT